MKFGPDVVLRRTANAADGPTTTPYTVLVDDQAVAVASFDKALQVAIAAKLGVRLELHP